MRIGNWTFIYFKDIAYNGILPKFRYHNSDLRLRLGLSIYFFKHVFRIDYIKRKAYFEYEQDAYEIIKENIKNKTLEKGQNIKTKFYEIRQTKSP